MRVVGIDPAPGKGGHVFDPESEFKTFSPRELGKFLEDLRRSSESVLVCWDSPLTGPSEPDGSIENQTDLTTRPIERFFTPRTKYDVSRVPGISVKGYGSCPHWTISRRLLGLPRVGPWDRNWKSLPFSLVTNFSDITARGHFVTEVHPAVAMWLWCGGPNAPRTDWRYKAGARARRDQIIKSLWGDLGEKLSDRCLELGIFDPWSRNVGPSNDDELDCIVSWLLGALLIYGNRDVAIFGHRQIGAFLLPWSEDLQRDFGKFANNENRQTNN